MSVAPLIVNNTDMKTVWDKIYWFWVFNEDTILNIMIFVLTIVVSVAVGVLIIFMLTCGCRC